MFQDYTLTTMIVSSAAGLIGGVVWLYKTRIPNKTRDIVLLAASWVMVFLLPWQRAGAKVLWFGDSGISLRLFGVVSVATVLAGAIYRKLHQRRAQTAQP